MEEDFTTMVFYKSWFDTFQTIEKVSGPEAAKEFLIAIFNYVFYKEKPDEDSTLWIYGLSTIFDKINRDQRRFLKRRQQHECEE